MGEDGWIVFGAALLGAVFGALLTAAISFKMVVNHMHSNAAKTDEIARQQKRAFRPKRLIFIRHGESLGNIDPTKYAEIADNRMPLSEKGKEEAIKAGVELRELLGDESVRWFVSPYSRTVQKPEEMIQHMEERKKFGRFWYRFPFGESGADVYDRVDSFIGNLSRQMDSQHPEGPMTHRDNFVFITHGLTMRLLCMRYLRWSVEQFEQVWNPDNCDIWVMNKCEKDMRFGSYQLVTKIRYGVGGDKIPKRLLSENMATTAPAAYHESKYHPALGQQHEQQRQEQEQLAELAPAPPMRLVGSPAMGQPTRRVVRAVMSPEESEESALASSTSSL